ncbi:MAG TPA: hypothetical protein VFB89_07615 [Gemmatimonadales bacterium]|nr:hypothetical protein [Gemmatimonadales bacterium]
MRPTLLLFVALLSLGRAAWPQGNPVGPEFRVNTYTTNAQTGSAVASDGSGNFVVVWESNGQDGSISGVFGQRYASAGPPLGPEFRINTYTTDNQLYPSIAADATGNFLVVWSGYPDGSSFGVFGQRYTNSGTPLGVEYRVNAFTTAGQSHPAVASATSGIFVIVWDSQVQDGSIIGIFGQRFAGTGAPLGPEFRINTYTTGPQGQPRVAADAAGNFVVVWVSTPQDGSDSGVFGQRYASSGAPLGPEFRANSFTTDNQFAPNVASDASGNFVVVWTSYAQDGSSSGVFGQRYASSGAPLGAEFRINTFTSGEQLRASVAADAGGNFVVTWQGYGQDGSNWGIVAQRYSSSGVPLGGEFLVNTLTTGDQLQPSVSSDAAGHFVVAWQSYAQDGSDNGIFAQRYSMIVPVELQSFRVE